MDNKHFTFNDDQLTLYNKKYELKKIFSVWASIIALNAFLGFFFYDYFFPKISSSLHIYVVIGFAVFVLLTMSLCIRVTRRILREGGKLRFSIDQVGIIFKENSSLSWQEVNVITFFEFKGTTYVGFYRDENEVSIWRNPENGITFPSKLVKREKFLLFIKQFYSGPIRLQSFS